MLNLADEAFTAGEYCGAYEEYQKASSYGVLDEKASANSAQAYATCYPAEPAATEPPVEPTPTP